MFGDYEWVVRHVSIAELAVAWALPAAVMVTSGAAARGETPGMRPVTFAAARAAGEAAAPDVTLAAGRDAVTRAQLGIAGALANPT
ncbi:MAG: hypothetical protein ABUS79_10320, partial [Pseudomonadota bacterium]